LKKIKGKFKPSEVAQIKGKRGRIFHYFCKYFQNMIGDDLLDINLFMLEYARTHTYNNIVDSVTFRKGLNNFVSELDF